MLQMIGIIVMDHGSKSPEANTNIDKVAARLRTLLDTASYTVETAHMEIATPTLDQAVASCVEQGAMQVIVHPLMLAPGKHVQQDIPAMVRQACKHWPQLRISITPPIGDHPLLAQIILDRCGLA